MDESAIIERQLSIKVKTCQRLSKEAAYYKVEAAENEAKLAKMKSSGRDPYDIKKFEEVLGESYMMIPDSEARFQKSLQDLQAFVQKTNIQRKEDCSEWTELALQLLEQNGKATNITSNGITAVEKSTDDGAITTSLDDLVEGEEF